MNVSVQPFWGSFGQVVVASIPVFACLPLHRSRLMLTGPSGLQQKVNLLVPCRMADQARLEALSHVVSPMPAVQEALPTRGWFGGLPGCTSDDAHGTSCFLLRASLPSVTIQQQPFHLP